MFGIDYTELGGIKLKSIEDIDALIKNKNVIISMSQGHIYTIEDKKGHCINCTNIQISDEKIAKLNIGIKTVGYFCKEYVLLNMSINDKGNNLLPLSYDDYNKRLSDAIDHIYNTYGIELDTENISFRTLEINKTFILNNSWSMYQESLILFTNLMPKKYKNIKTISDNNKQIKQITIENKSIAIKIYNKKSQLKEMKKHIEIDTSLLSKMEGFKEEIDIENIDIMRIEIVFKTHQKIKQVFKDNKLKNIKQEYLEKFFDTEILNTIIKNFDLYMMNYHIKCNT